MRSGILPLRFNDAFPILLFSGRRSAGISAASAAVVAAAPVAAALSCLAGFRGDALFPNGCRSGFRFGALLLPGTLCAGAVVPGTVRPWSTACRLVALPLLLVGGLGGFLFDRRGGLLAGSAASAAATPVTAAVLTLATLA